jgi:uncharacterized protein YjiS (DUF1127 family)
MIMSTLTWAGVAAAGFSAQAERHAQEPQGSERLRLAWALAARAPHTLRAAWAERRRVRRAVLQLDALSDRMLADIGLARSDIGRVARFGREAAAERSDPIGDALQG